MWMHTATQADAEYGGLRPGDLIGPYELLFPMAEGGMGTVWAARLQRVRGFQKLMAVKLLSEALLAELDSRTMFLDEARNAARISHPNVGQVFDYGEDCGRPYLAMEWIEGESLTGIVAAQHAHGGRLPLGWVLHVAVATCAGLHAAHEARDEAGELIHLVHRDISPQNVMVTFDGFAKVVDFGVAKSRCRAQITRAGVIKGKIGYLSPEQVAAGEVDRRSDLFSFGVLLYLLVTNHHPFHGRNPVETIQRIANLTPHAPRDLIPGIPEELDAIILRALEKKPEDRFQTAEELQRALERVAGASGAPLTDREAGAVVKQLLPGAADRRRARLARAVGALEPHASGPPESAPADELAERERDTVPERRPSSGPGSARPEAEHRTPGGTAAPTGRSASRARAGGLLALTAVAAAVIAVRAADWGALPRVPHATAGVALQRYDTQPHGREPAPAPPASRSEASSREEVADAEAPEPAQTTYATARAPATSAPRAAPRGTKRPYQPSGI
jgi:eukaryotic-like serine/threonine-protein kinase